MISDDVKIFLGRPDATDADIEALRGTSVHIPLKRGKKSTEDFRGPSPIQICDGTRGLLAAALKLFAVNLGHEWHNSEADTGLSPEQIQALRNRPNDPKLQQLLGAALESLATDLMRNVPTQD